MKVVNKRGTHIITKKIHMVIDPTTLKSANESDIVLISHAHSDHIKNAEKVMPIKIMSKASLDLLNLKLKNGSEILNFRIIKAYEKPEDELNFKGCKIRAYHAGHCLGSLQFRIKIDNKIIVYTGDFCLESRFGMNKAPLLKCKDGILITDDTYFSDDYIFPMRTNLYPEILNFFRKSLEKNNEIFVIAHRLGVQQEITALVNYSTLSCKLYAHPAIFLTNQVHSSYFPLGKFQYKKPSFQNFKKIKTLNSFFNGEDPKENNGNSKSIILLPYYYIGKINELKKKFRKDSIIVATGWAKTQNFGVKSFPLSSHAGYDQILNYKKVSEAQNLSFF